MEQVFAAIIFFALAGGFVGGLIAAIWPSTKGDLGIPTE
jgi:hypothetical protein